MCKAFSGSQIPKPRHAGAGFARGFDESEHCLGHHGGSDTNLLANPERSCCSQAHSCRKCSKGEAPLANLGPLSCLYGACLGSPLSSFCCVGEISVGVCPRQRTGYRESEVSPEKGICKSCFCGSSSILCQQFADLAHGAVQSFMIAKPACCDHRTPQSG